MALTDFRFDDRQTNPVDTIEAVAALNDWEFQRPADDEITICVEGNWIQYDVSFSWMSQVEALQVACAFDIKVNEGRSTEIVRLLALVNGQMWCGHFDLWTKEGVVIYRQSLPLSGGIEPTAGQVQTLLSNALDSCERYYQAFQFVTWAGHSAKEALECSMFETHGEA